MKFVRLFLISILSLCYSPVGFCGYDNAPEYIEDNDDVFIRLKLPEALVMACQDPYWAITDESIVCELTLNLATQETFSSWCKLSNCVFSEFKRAKYTVKRKLLSMYAFICYHANEKGYSFTDTFCKEHQLDMVLLSILSRGSTSCFGCNSHVEEYLKNFSILIENM